MKKQHRFTARKFLNICLIFSAFSALPSCTMNPEGKPLAEMTFNHISPFPVDVASYEIQNKTDGSFGFTAKQPENFVANLSQTLSDYLHSRFGSVGDNGKLLVVLEQADVTQKQMPSDNKIGSILNVDNKDQYEMNVAVRLAIYGANGFDVKETTIRGYRAVTMSEHLTLAERERHQMEAMDNLIDDLDGAIQKVLVEEFKVMRSGYY